jgi:gamma-glutamyltranspeptidase / glutathione hydrolase
VDYGLDVQAAADSPRWHHEGSSQSMGEDRRAWDRGLLRLEAGVPAATRKALEDLGWPMGRATADSGATKASKCAPQGGPRVRGGQRDALRRGGAGVLS